MLKHYGSLVAYKAWADLRTEASRTYLGLLWWAFEPLMYLAVFWVVRGIVLQSRENLVPFLLVGIVTFQWLTKSVGTASGTILGGKGLMLRVYLPKAIFPASRILTNAFKFACLFSMLLMFLWSSGFAPGITYLSLPVLLGVQLLFVSAVSFTSAAVVPLFPDLRFVIENLMMALFWLSGIFFSVERLPEDLRVYFYLNPMASLIEDYRGVLLHDSWPGWTALLIITACSLAGIWFGLALIRRFDHLYPKITQ